VALQGRLILAFVLFLLTTSCGGSAQSSTPFPPSGGSSYVLTWSDDFGPANGSSPDSAKWVMETGGGGWGNNELESYTSRPENAKIQDGNLVITAIQEDFTGTDGIARHYTSARLKTQGKFDQKYGRFETRIKIPAGQGIWPAFWMLGNNINTVSWPSCGEIDIMENIGKEPSTVHGSLHASGFDSTGSYALNAGKFADDFHVFAIEWEPAVIRFYVDGHLYDTRTPADVPAGQTWAFDHPFFLLLNVAVGGNWPGSPDETSTFPQTMLVDYVRVYSKQ
jgi:beta-glucanase (GH16 family)